MTAYGRASLNTDVGHFTVEIQSVNRKFLEVNVVLPRELSHFDIEIKKWLLPFASRGQITVKVTASFDGQAPFVVVPNLALAKQMKQAWDQIAHHLQVGDSKFELSLLAQADDILRFEENREEEESYRHALKHAFDQALKGFLHMKTQEGTLLQVDILNRIEKIRHWMVDIEGRAPYATKKYREKLMSRLEELLPGHVENEDRILREIALFAEKIDITEEITRFYCHLLRFEELSQSSSMGGGKTLEFILQELNREVNTIGNKSSDLEIARQVIDIKSELERIREQIQNIE
ncbi:YicC/YloC family endoribonuclease [Candidatus Protochlamydia phocaeensis]|uniref:YicC/YloC family endoribonuclease n=1 Tax=Candidatus Protochlamydia phocaeensis TaxID=1414722 RepID=UPI0008393285|nr:YicC/YloC family endoribonuclease [Candidatus Protochlamydia phocaeensis]